MTKKLVVDEFQRIVDAGWLGGGGSEDDVLELQWPDESLWRIVIMDDELGLEFSRPSKN